MMRLTLNNGVQMPALGLGVFQSLRRTRPRPQSNRRSHAAIASSTRRRRTLNERQVGEGIRRSGISRDEVFIETKVWISDYGYDATLHAFDKSAGKLGVDRLDLPPLHQPLPSASSARSTPTARSRSCLLTAGCARSA